MAEEPHVHELVDHLFRHQAGQMIATLSHIFGLENLDLAEEVVQDALLQALRQWSFGGIPDNPRVWLIRVARNRALDLLRRRASLRRKRHSLEKQFEERQCALNTPDAEVSEELADEQLAMIFACCDPKLPPEARVALTLKAVSGFSVAEIAHAFLTEEATVAQRLVRAKKRIRDTGIRLAQPPASELDSRLDSVLKVLYLLFNEGYGAHAGENLIREDLCEEAVRLAQLLAARPWSAQPKVHALLSLFYLQAARFTTRVDGDGNLLLLEDQQRSEWDQGLIGLGLRQLDLSAQGDELSEYHLQAGIAAVHIISPSFATTNWTYLLGLYDQLLVLAPSPVVALNRAVAFSMLEGPAAALRSLDELGTNPVLRNYFLLHAVRADFLRRLGRSTEAAEGYRLALTTSCTEPERRFLLKRLQELDPATSRDCSSS